MTPILFRERPVCIAVLVLLLALTPSAGAVEKSHWNSDRDAPGLLSPRQTARIGLSFEANEGQAGDKIRYLTRAGGLTVLFRLDGLTLSAPTSRAVELPGPEGGVLQSASSAIAPPTSMVGLDTRGEASTVQLEFLGTSGAADIVSGPELPGRINYLLGNDPSGWHTDIRTYGSITYRSLYPGIDLAYTGIAGDLKGTYVLDAGIDPSLLVWRYEGADRPEVSVAGDLRIPLGGARAASVGAELIEAAPIAWQEEGAARRPVAVRYEVRDDGSVSYEVGKYDRGRPLIIDPTLEYSTYLGGSGTDVAQSIQVDSAGYAYVGGFTGSTNFPTASAYQSANRSSDGLYDGFVTKLAPDGQSLVYSTYIGGQDYEWGYDVAVDSEGGAALTGLTKSVDFPSKFPCSRSLTGICVQDPGYGLAGLDPTGTFEGGAGGSTDAFVTKLTPDGSGIVFSRFFGASDGGYEASHGIAFDSAGNAYLGGVTGGSDFPVTPGAYQEGPTDELDAFVASFDPLGRYRYATYVGGGNPPEIGKGRNMLGGMDWGTGIAVDGTGRAVVVGVTWSREFPTTENAFQSRLAKSGDDPYNDESDAFLSQLSPDGSELEYSTYLGAEGIDPAQDVGVDASGMAYVMGLTTSLTFPTTEGAAQPVFGGGLADSYVTKLDTGTGKVVYSTYVGGSGNDARFVYGHGGDVDKEGNVLLSGTTAASDYPGATILGDKVTLSQREHTFLVKLGIEGTIDFYAYLGGSRSDKQDWANDAALGPNGDAYITGLTGSTDFPTTLGAYQTEFGGVNDVFVARVRPGD